MNAKDVYFGALEHFRVRNADILPQVQLQHGRNERWFQREWTFAINRHLTGQPRPHSFLPLYADCEEDYADISVWQAALGHRERVFAYEVKTIYRSLDWRAEGPRVQGIVDAAWTQLERAQLGPGRKGGIFFVVYDRRGEAEGSEIDEMKSSIKRTIDSRFHSDHDIRLTELSALSAIEFANGVWHTQSWVTVGYPRAEGE